MIVILHLGRAFPENPKHSKDPEVAVRCRKQQLAARFQHAINLTESEFRFYYMFDNLGAPDKIERLTRKWQWIVGIPTQDRVVLWFEVYGDNLIAPRLQFFRPVLLATT